MKIELHEITIREIAKGYIDNDEEGVLNNLYKIED